ncbi:MAG: NFACT family protein [Planctomycetes bacterium]|nr:NFACT family protein [Planctomycetota bacterium]
MDAVDARLALQRRGRTALSLSARHVAELAAELAPLLEGAELADVHPLPPHDFLLVFAPRGVDFVRRVRASLHPDASRLHLQHERVELHEGSVGPFFRGLVDELRGAKLARLGQVRGDRVLRFDFVDTPSGRARALVLELFGRRSNAYVVDGDDKILALAVPPPADKKDPRSAVGLTWSPPTSRAGAEPGPELAASLPEPPAPPRGTTEAPLSWRVEHALASTADSADHERFARELTGRVQRKLERARALEHGLVERARAGDEAERVRQDGELVKANLSLVTRGATRIEVDDLFDPAGAKRVLALDPKKRPMENAEAYFERSRKLVRARETVGEELERTREKIRALEELLARAADAAADPRETEARAIEAGLLDARQEPDARRREKHKPEPRKPYRSYRGCKGSEIRVGRNAADNDDLTFHYARGNDVWLHTADTPGSHVVLVLAGRPEPDPEELVDAAHLAAHFSPLEQAARVRVHVARRKEVHKPRGTKPGLVHLSGGKILDLRVQQERTKRLLETARTPPPAT